MSAVCPQGHTSASEDYCDTCGAPIAAATSAPTPSAPVEAGEQGSSGPTTCPNCGSPAAPKALFCENCGYDFTTGTPPAPLTLPAPVPAPDPDPVPDPAGDPDPDPDPAGQQEAKPQPDPSGLPTPAAPGPDSWVVELWVDPDWYAEQSPEDAMPSPGSPSVIPLREASVLVGRPSASRNIHPQVDVGADTGVSRRHCQLSTDGQSWSVEDLDSANGTFVSLAGEPLPTTPLDPGTRHELAEDERVFIGGWTRLVIRRALPGEA